jgi:hypothetical protein
MLCGYWDGRIWNYKKISKKSPAIEIIAPVSIGKKSILVNA